MSNQDREPRRSTMAIVTSVALPIVVISIIVYSGALFFGFVDSPIFTSVSTPTEDVAGQFITLTPIVTPQSTAVSTTSDTQLSEHGTPQIPDSTATSEFSPTPSTATETPTSSPATATPIQPVLTATATLTGTVESTDEIQELPESIGPFQTIESVLTANEPHQFLFQGLLDVPAIFGVRLIDAQEIQVEILDEQGTPLISQRFETESNSLLFSAPRNDRFYIRLSSARPVGYVLTMEYSAPESDEVDGDG